MTEKELLEKLNIDSENGMRLIMKEYGAAVMSICRNFLYDCQASDVEETIADTFINFWKGRDKVKSSLDKDSRYSLKSYIYAIARNAARDKRRTLNMQEFFSLDEVEMDIPDEVTPETESLKREREMILHECLASMDEPGKSIFLYRYFYGFKVADIADRLGLTPKQVDNHLYRGKDRLKKALIERGITNA